MKKSKVVVFVMILFMVLIASFVVWANEAAKPDFEAMKALQSDQNVTVIDNQKDLITFLPSGDSSGKALIFYPGGRVDFRAYSPLLHDIATSGHPVFLVKMPLNLAVFGVNKASQIISDNPQIHSWAIGGHSLGGAMAANYTFKNPDLISGLALWASYPASSNDLSLLDLEVVSISGTNDGLATPEKIQASIPLLPNETNWIIIQGGNHAQFGSYGSQTGDNQAAINSQDQKDQVVKGTVQLLNQLP